MEEIQMKVGIERAMVRVRAALRKSPSLRKLLIVSWSFWEYPTLTYCFFPRNGFVVG